MTRPARRLPLKAALMVTALSLASPAIAQEGPARYGTFSFSQDLRFSDNVDLSDAAPNGTALRTGLDLSLTTETRTQSLTFSIGTDILGEFGSGLDDEFAILNPNASLVYRLEGANSTITASARYSESDLEDDVFDLGDGSSLIIDSGEVARTSLAFGLDTGTGGPVELDLDLGYRELDYQDTTDPDLVDEDRASIDALARFRVSPALTVRARAGYAKTDEADASLTERVESYVGIGVETETASGLSIFGDLIYDRSEVTVAGPTTTTDDGLGIELGVTQDRPNGDLRFTLSSRIDDSGRRSTAEVERNLETKTGGIGFSLGVVDQEGDDTLRLIGGLDYTRELPRGDITASLTQGASSRDGSAFLNTSLSLGYAAEINAVSGWQAGLSYTETNELGGAEDDSRTTATLSYLRDLTEDWSMQAGVEHIRVEESGVSDRSSNSIFFNIGRDITFGF